MKNIILILSSFFFFSCSNFYQPAVVSARKEATQIGLEIMKNGGNAYDAMIATHLALAVVHPTAGNIGGGGFFVYHHKDGYLVWIDSFKGDHILNIFFDCS